ncbi:hypothetical protein [Geomonas azotofigens]|uniref:hypothetical protein n=1 Tax=Geomonas azotofigens TaxID=2843196 RepID=UPI001C100D72|nr:hypothetical protein [Geomonas azotofigens]MBU5614684.1 hypothetical protein [Geomonas azotofigens]
MQDKSLSDFTSFTGTLRAGEFNIQITFLARIDNRGEVEFNFAQIPLTKENIFIKKHWNNDNFLFTLSGQSDDGILFKTEYFQFNSVGHQSSKDCTLLNLAGFCSKAEFQRDLTKLSPKPVIQMWLKGFQSFRPLTRECQLGTVTMGGKTTIKDPDTITGFISVRMDYETDDLLVWRKEADKLLEHLRRVMSFASATVIQNPVIEFRSGNKSEVFTFSQTRQAPAFMQTFHFLNYEPIFEAALNSFFNPPFKANNLFFAIEWFAMDATYNEVRLVNAMTVLENLIAANLDDSFALIRPAKEFEKIKNKLRQEIKKCLAKWSSEESEKANEIVVELNERLSDLNRRSIFHKIKALSKSWSVPLDGISDDEIKAAKKARDLIVHRGQYYQEDKEDQEDLWSHVAVIREVVVRFVLTALGYRGRYISYYGGYHDAHFPP